MKKLNKSGHTLIFLFFAGVLFNLGPPANAQSAYACPNPQQII